MVYTGRQAGMNPTSEWQDSLRGVYTWLLSCLTKVRIQTQLSTVIVVIHRQGDGINVCIIRWKDVKPGVPSAC